MDVPNDLNLREVFSNIPECIQVPQFLLVEQMELLIKILQR